MRVVSLHPDVLVATSAIWQTNCTIVRGTVNAAPERAGNPVVVRIAAERAGGAETAAERAGGGETAAERAGGAETAAERAGGAETAAERAGGAETAAERAGGGEVAAERAGGGETFVIDSPVLPAELEALPTLLLQSGFPSPNGLLATHGDWDHLLGRLAFPDVALGCAESTSARLAAAPGAAQRELRTFDRGFYIERPHPLSLGQVQALPVPGHCGIGDHELELHPAEGHTEDGMAVWVPWARVLVCGDYLSTVEPPEVGQGSSVGAYRDTLERLRPLVEVAERVVPGHGPVLDTERALDVLEKNLASLTG